MLWWHIPIRHYYSNLRFENGVILYGSKTTGFDDSSINMFENGVILYGSKTL